MSVLDEVTGILWVLRIYHTYNIYILQMGDIKVVCCNLHSYKGVLGWLLDNSFIISRFVCSSIVCYYK